MSTTFRAELQRLVKAYDEHGGKWPDHHVEALFQAVEDARAALAQPEPVAPTIQPVPVSEGLPGPKDWDVCGRCWMFDPCSDGWWAYRSALPSDDELGRPPWTHWLPHWALPVPTNTTRKEN
jgi:hypothetical protein